jgi:hypothetical protein
MAASASQVKQARKIYAEVKREYKKLGKRAQGKAKNSVAYMEYKTAKRAYKQVGNALGRMTGKKPRRKS